MKKHIRNIITLAVLLLAVLGFSFTGISTWLENKTYDSRMKTTAPFKSPSDRIGLVLLDQESLNWAQKELGWGWPWPRSSYGAMLDYFKRAGAVCVAFDMIYSEESIYGQNDDKTFADACLRSNNAILASHTITSNGQSIETKPIPILENSCAMLADVTGLSDSDGIIRREEDEFAGHPTLSFAALSLGGELPEKTKYSKKGGINIRYLEGLERYVPYKAMSILRTEYAIEAAEKTDLGIESIDFEKDDLIPPEQFKDNFVFFGLYAPGLFDICSTPVSANYQGVGVHISLLDTVLQQDWLVEAPALVTVILAIAAVLIGFIFGSSLLQRKIPSVSARTVCSVAVVALYCAISYIAFYNGLVLNMTITLFALVFSFIAFVFEDYVTEGHQKKYLRTAFSQYLSPAVIGELIENPSLLKLGGEEREITAYFSDVQGFTSISEGLSPAKLTDLLNKYLSAMTDIILSYGGTIDKYEGDAIVAFWGAPVYQKDHAVRALNAALACQKKLAEMAMELEEFCGKVFRQRIGLNTGKAAVGNMGSSKRFDYTMMGDTVNLASRLEGMNKQFDTYTMCSKATMESALANGSLLKFRELGTVAVVGKKTGVTVYTPMEADIFKSEEMQSIQNEFSKAYTLFKSGEFKKALEIFTKIEGDGPSHKYIEKCLKLIENPPQDWDGTIRATEK